MTVALAGTRPASVIELLRDRRARGAAATRARRLALVVEGGGMRGVLSAGSLLAIDELGFRGCFDAVFASSAGGVNAAYFLSGQGRLGITVYFDSINNRRFFNPWRPWKIVDVAYVYDEIVASVKRLDEDALRAGGPEFYLSVTDARTGANVVIDVKRAPDPVHRVLKASSALPILYNRCVRLSNGLYVDGGISDPMPIRRAIESGCTDVLILSTRPIDHVNPDLTAMQQLILRAAVGLHRPRLAAACRLAHTRANTSRDLASGREQVPDVNVASIAPSPDESMVDRLTMDRNVLIGGARLMATRACEALGEDPAALEAVFGTFA